MSDVESDIDEPIGLTSVLLGYVGREASYVDLSTYENFVGGSPMWFAGRGPSKDLVQCLVCEKPLDLMAQLSCPLPDKYYDRALYVFSCADPNCRRKKGSIRALRGVQSTDEITQRIKQEESDSRPENNIAPSQGDIGDRLFTASGGDNPFASDNPFAGANPFSQPSTTSKPAAQAPKKSSKPSKKTNRIVQGRYSCRILDVEDEFIDPEVPKEYAGVRVEEAEEEATDPVDIKDIKEIEAREDPAFSKFVTVVEHNPEQVLRYERGLVPLLYSSEDGVHEELDELLHSKDKIVEVQLMPHLIAELETDDMLADGMEWGTVFVATDSKDRLPQLDSAGVGYTEEDVVVQWEKLNA